RYETMRTYAKKSMESAPRFVEAYALFARINLNSGEHLDESEAALKKAISIAPGRDDLKMLLAQTYLREDRNADGRAVLSEIERSASVRNCAAVRQPCSIRLNKSSHLQRSLPGSKRMPATKEK